MWEYVLKKVKEEIIIMGLFKRVNFNEESKTIAFFSTLFCYLMLLTFFIVFLYNYKANNYKLVFYFCIVELKEKEENKRGHLIKKIVELSSAL